jgi:anti-anti-sigma factor
MGKVLQDLVHRQDELQWEQTLQGDAEVFRCAGAFSLVSHEQLEKIGAAVKASHAPRMVMDLREVAHMDSAGLGTLAMIVKVLMPGKRLLVVIPSPQVRNLMVSTGLDRVVPFAESIPAALEVQPQ